MAKWHIDRVEIDRCGEDALEITIEGKKAKILTEDLATVVKEELPQDRADKLLSAIDEQQVQDGKIRVMVEAKNNIKKGDTVRFMLDIRRYMDRHGNPTGISTHKSGILLFNK